MIEVYNDIQLMKGLGPTIPPLSSLRFKLPWKPLNIPEFNFVTITHHDVLNAFKKANGYYNPNMDTISIRKLETFITSEVYYMTLFHELVHSTGHFMRLNRRIFAIGQSCVTVDDTFFEECIAQIGSLMLCHYYNIKTDLVVEYSNQ